MRTTAFIILVLVRWLATYNAPEPKAPDMISAQMNITVSSTTTEVPVSDLGLSG